jgi:hypothetical protein
MIVIWLAGVMCCPAFAMLLLGVFHKSAPLIKEKKGK